MSQVRISLMQQVAFEAGNLLQDFFQKPLDIDAKGEVNLVTEADRAAEAIILDRVRESFPDDRILAEESGAFGGTSDFDWIIDPLDGTTNFAHGLPHFAVSIAIAHREQTIAGAVYDPIKREYFEVKRGQGATLNGQPIRVSATQKLGHALCVSGFPYNRRQRLKPLLARVERALMHAQGFRRLGAAALDLAYIASGRLDVFWEDGLQPWDLAAGELMVRESQGTITAFNGGPFSLSSGEVLATNGCLHHQVIERIIAP